MMTPVSSSLRSDLNIATKVIESSHEPQDGFGTIALGEVIGPRILVFDTVFEHVPDGGEHGSGDREDGFLGATPTAQTQYLGWQVAVFPPHGAAQAAVTSAVFNHGEPLRVWVERRLPALSSFLG